MKTSAKIPHSSLCRKVSFTLPDCWEKLSQTQLRQVLSLYAVLADQSEGMQEVKLAAFCKFCSVRIVKRADGGWVCRKMMTDEEFLLDPALLPDILAPLDFIDHPEEMTIRLESVGGYKAVDMFLHGVRFADYLTLENYYQGYLLGRDNFNLRVMTRMLYGMTEEDGKLLRPEVLLGTFLWYGAVKHHFAVMFPNFFKPASKGGGSDTGTAEGQREMMNIQIRMLTKGDVTKTGAVMESDVWDALTELDAQAKEAEEMKRKYKNHGK